MWTQLWKTPDNNDSRYKSILIEATVEVAVEFIRKKYPNTIIKQYGSEHLDIGREGFALIQNSDLTLLTQPERYAESYEDCPTIEGESTPILFSHKKNYKKIPKENRYMNLEKYLKLPNVEIYYKDYVDTVLERF